MSCDGVTVSCGVGGWAFGFETGSVSTDGAGGAGSGAAQYIAGFFRQMSRDGISGARDFDISGCMRAAVDARGGDGLLESDGVDQRGDGNRFAGVGSVGLGGFKYGSDAGECRVDRDRNKSQVDDARVTFVSAGSHCDGRGRATNSDFGKSDSDVLKSSNDGSCVSSRTLRNRRKREQRKCRKVRKQCGSAEVKRADVPEWRRGARGIGGFGDRRAATFGLCSEDTQRKLLETRAARLIAENEASVHTAALHRAQAEKKIQLVFARDIEKIKKRDEVRIMRDTELGKVAVERAFSALSAAEGVSYVGGVAKTIKSSISPSSSVSEAEIRAMQKENLDLKKQNAALVEKMRDFRVGVDDDVACSVGITLDSHGNVVGDYGECVGGYIGEDGRLHSGIDFGNY